MAAEPPVRWASPPATQGPSQRAIFAGLLTFVAIVGLSWGVVSLIAHTWTTCADIDAGGAFALTVLWLVVVAILVAFLAIIVFSVPYKGLRGLAGWRGR